MNIMPARPRLLAFTPQEALGAVAGFGADAGGGGGGGVADCGRVIN
jgi:hypothetical protein